MKLLKLLIAYLISVATCWALGWVLLDAGSPAYQVGLIMYDYPWIASLPLLALWLFAQ